MRDLCWVYKIWGEGELPSYISVSRVCGNIMAKECDSGRSVIIFPLGFNEKMSFS